MHIHTILPFRSDDYVYSRNAPSRHTLRNAALQLLHPILLPPHRSVYRRAKPKYPIIPPEGRTDIIFPRTDIPRPINEDVRRYPEFFGKEKKKRKAERLEKVKRKK